MIPTLNVLKKLYPLIESGYIHGRKYSEDVTSP